MRPTPVAMAATELAAELGPKLGLGAVLVVGAVVASLVVGSWAVVRIIRGLPVIPSRPHPPVEWTGGDVAFVAGLHLLFAILAVELVRSERPSSDTLLAATAAGLAATGLGMGFLRSRGATAASLGFPRATLADLGLAVGGLAGVLAPLLMLAGWLDQLVPYSHPVIDLLTSDPTLKTRLAVVLSAVVGAPVAEEFFFRRVLQGWLERWVPGGAAVSLAAAVFALMHWGQGLAWAPLFLLGLVLGEIVRRTGSLVPAILLHASFNAVSVALLLSGVVPGPAGVPEPQRQLEAPLGPGSEAADWPQTAGPRQISCLSATQCGHGHGPIWPHGWGGGHNSVARPRRTPLHAPPHARHPRGRRRRLRRRADGDLRRAGPAAKRL